jgi:hypothetical protein
MHIPSKGWLFQAKCGGWVDKVAKKFIWAAMMRG